MHQSPRNSHRLASLASAALLLLTLLGCSAGPGAQGAPAAAQELPASSGLDATLFERISILGASGSAGYGLQLETGVPTRLADFLDQALLAPHEVVSDGATELLFLDPEGIAGAAVAEALAAEPSLLVAPDFLFWFFYGQGPDTPARMRRLDVGLELLERFDCPVLVGDLPYMGAAAGGMIPFSSMPDEASFPAANARIQSWAAERKGVSIVPLAALDETLASGAAWNLGDFTWDPAERGPLLQSDHLHPNMAGTAILALECLKSLAGGHAAGLEGVSLEDPEALVDAVDDLVSAR